MADALQNLPSRERNKYFIVTVTNLFCEKIYHFKCNYIQLPSEIIYSLIKVLY